MTLTLWLVVATIVGITAAIVVPNLIVWRRRRK